MFRYRQSSASWISFGCIFLRYCRRLSGILLMATEALEISGKACGQTGPYPVVERIPDQCTGGLVGANLKRILNNVIHNLIRFVVLFYMGMTFNYYTSHLDITPYIHQSNTDIVVSKTILGS